jgi:hypothetical protein
MFDANRIVSLAADAIAEKKEALRVYWLALPDGSRDELARAIEQCRDEVPIVPVVLRQALFRDANTIPDDIHRLLNDTKAGFDRLDPKACTHGIVLLLLARTTFDLPQVGSSIILPSWFPATGGAEVFVRIADFGEEIETVLLNADEVRKEDLAKRLYSLERGLVTRLQIVAQRTPAKSAKFLEEVRGFTGATATADSVLQGYTRHLDNVSNPLGYRPTVKDARPLSSHLIRLALRSSPDELARVGERFAWALDLQPEMVLRPPLFAVLLRPASQLSEPAKSGHALLLTLYGSYQFLNGAAHAGDYPRFPVALIYSTSRDLRRALADAEVLVSAMGV